MNISENMGFTNWLRNPLTPVAQSGILPLATLRNHRRKETYGNGGTEEPLPVSWRMDRTHAQAKQGNAVCVCIQEKTRQGTKSVHCSSVKSRTNGSGSSGRETGVDQKIKPACGWPTTIENFVAFRSPHMPVWKTARDDPWILLLTLSIALDLKKIKALYRRAG